MLVMIMKMNNVYVYNNTCDGLTYSINKYNITSYIRYM